VCKWFNFDLWVELKGNNEGLSMFGHILMLSKKSTAMCRGFGFVFAALCFALLSGCNSMRIIESQVQTSTQWPATAATGVQSSAPPKAFFRLDRLPADVNNLQAGWAEIEVEAALAPLGWTRNDIEAQYTVWVGVRSAEFIADSWGRPVRSPWINHLHVNVVRGYRPQGLGIGWGIGMNSGMRAGFPLPSGYAQEVSIIIRDLKTSNVVYQTKASHEGPWSDHANIWRTMINAALQGFPNPQALTRRVDTSISR